MAQQTIARYNESILQQAMQRYGIAKHQIKPLDAFESFIYEFERDGLGYILRIGHTFRKSAALIQAEVDWINYLARGGVSVARAIPSESGNLVEAIDDNAGGHLLVTAFVNAAGQTPWDAGLTPAPYEIYGRLIGQMHALAVNYHPHPACRRPEWNDVSMNFIELYLPTSDVGGHQAY